MARVLLVSANRCVDPDPVFPLGLAYVNAALRAAGHQTRWHDVQTGSRLERVLAEYQPEAAGISLRNIDDVLVRRRETFFGELAELCRVMREAAGCPVVLGGSGFSIFPRELMELSGADFGIRGEGEGAFVALLEALSSGADYHSIPGLVFRCEGGLVLNEPAPAGPPPPLASEDRPPEIAAHYLERGGMLNIQTQRGCPLRCCYCTYPLIEGRRRRPHPPEAVAEEFERAARLGARYLFVVDSVFNSSARHAGEICEALARRGSPIPWSCFLRPQGLTPELMRLMARAGLAHIEFGTDSFCDPVLASYQKGFTFAEVRQASELARQAGIEYCHFLIAGGPGETYETLEEGFRNSERLREAAILSVAGMRVYPGTAVARRALDEGLLSPGQSLLEPFYYLSPALTFEGVFAKLAEFTRRDPRWTPQEKPPAFRSMMLRLRQRGVVGPAWSYASLIQRVWAPPSAG